MTLYDLFVVLNDNTTIQLYDCETYNLIDSYDGTEAYAESIDDIELHTGGYAYEKGDE